MSCNHDYEQGGCYICSSERDRNIELRERNESWSKKADYFNTSIKICYECEDDKKYGSHYCKQHEIQHKRNIICGHSCVIK